MSENCKCYFYSRVKLSCICYFYSKVNLTVTGKKSVIRHLFEDKVLGGTQNKNTDYYQQLVSSVYICMFSVSFCVH